MTPTEQLIDDLQAAGGELRVPAWRRDGDRDYRQLVLSAQRWGKVPRGKRLAVSQDAGELVIRFEEAIEGTEVDPQPVPVPKRVSRLHPVARRFRDECDHHEVSRKALARCTRIVHALVEEAEGRGVVCSNVGASKDSYGREKWSGGNDGHLVLSLRGHGYSLRVAEEGVPARGRWEHEARWRSSWSPHGESRISGSYDAKATGRLKISLVGYAREGRAASWADRTSWTLEDKLPELLRELEVRAAEDDYSRREAERAAAERRRIWELEMEKAKDRFAEAYRAKVLREQVAAWREADDIAAYVAALRSSHSESPETSEWIEWITGYLAERDPRQSTPSVPEPPEPTPEDLKPFLPGLSPYGPSRF